MSKLKMNNKYLSEKIIYENLFEDYAITFDKDIYTYIEKLMYKESNLPKITYIDEDNIYNFLEGFYKRISHILATEGSVRKQVVYNTIENILIKYPYKI
jgi:hypothetical protein